MWSKELQSPRWFETRRYAGIMCGRARRLAAFLLAACDPRFGQSAGDDGVAWLNGLRGFAAFLVYLQHHHQYIPHGELQLTHAFGYDGKYYFGSMPFVRFFFVGGGQISVALFFTISGYVLTYSPLRLIQTRPEAAELQMATKIGTSFARRWLRLFLPVIAVTFAFMASWHIFHIRSGALRVAAPTARFSAEVIRWLREFVDGSYVFHTVDAFGKTNYNPHMWSIAVEYRGSLLVYTVVLAYFALGYSASARFWATLGLAIYFHFSVSGHYYAAFLMGMLICDLNIVSDIDTSQLPSLFRLPFFRKTKWLYYVLFLAGIYLGSIPHLRYVAQLQEEPGWHLLSRLVPNAYTDVTWYFVVFSATLLVISIPHIRWLKRTFESEPMQYLGKISFGLYLVHGPLMWTIGDRIYAAVGRPNWSAQERIPEWINCFPISDRGPLGMEINTMLPHIVLLPLTLWVATVVTKLVDTPTVRLTKYLFGARKKPELEISGAAKRETMPTLSLGEATLPR